MFCASAPLAIKASRTDCGTALTEAAIVFRRSALIGESGDDDLTVVLLEEARDLLDLAVFRGADRLAIEVEIDRLKLIPVDVAAEERSAFLSFGQWRASNIVARVAGRLTALLFRTMPAGPDCQEQRARPPSLTTEQKRINYGQS